MYNSRLLKVLALVGISLSLLVGFEQKFAEQNQTGSPQVKTDDDNKMQNGVTGKFQETGEELDDSSILFEAGPASEDKKKFEGWFSHLEEQIREKTDIRSRLEVLQRGLAKMENDRQELQNLKFNEEIEIDFLIKPLKILPKGDQFKVQDCTEYKMKILSHFDPTAEDEVKDPSLKKAINVFKLICTM